MCGADGTGTTQSRQRATRLLRLRQCLGEDLKDDQERKDRHPGLRWRVEAFRGRRTRDDVEGDGIGGVGAGLGGTLTLAPLSGGAGGERLPATDWDGRTGLSALV